MSETTIGKENQIVNVFKIVRAEDDDNADLDYNSDDFKGPIL